MGMALKSIDVAVLFVKDLDRAKGFYRDTVGLTTKHEDENSAFFPLGGASLLLLSLAGAQDLLAGEEGIANPPTGARSQLVASVDDVDAVYADLMARGVEGVHEPVDRWWGLRTAHFRDPDGNIWEINQPVDKDADTA